MDCDEAEELLALLGEEKIIDENLGAHLHVCPACRGLFANLLLVRAMSRFARDEWRKHKTFEFF